MLHGKYIVAAMILTIMIMMVMVLVVLLVVVLQGLLPQSLWLDVFAWLVLFSLQLQAAHLIQEFRS